MQTWKVSFVVLCACVLCACPAPSGNDGGTGGGVGVLGGGSGVTGGGSGTTGGGSAVTGGGSAITGGGTAVTGGGTASTGGGTGVTGGGSATTGGGTGVDAGPDCNTIALDPALGTLVLRNGATVSSYGLMPNDFVAVGAIGDQFWGLNALNQLRFLGALPTLAPGAVIPIRSPEDTDAGALIFGSPFVATLGTQVMVGYTKLDYSGALFIYETTDAGARYVSAPGNFTAASVANRWVVNSLGLDGLSDAGVYALDDVGAYSLAAFDPAWASGYTAATTNGVLLIGYSDSSFTNHLTATTPASYGASFAARDSISLSNATELHVEGTDGIAGIGWAGDDVVYLRSVNYKPARVEVQPLGYDGASLDAGTPETVLERVDVCTNLLFVGGQPDGVVVGVQDRTGSRLLKIAR